MKDARPYGNLWAAALALAALGPASRRRQAPVREPTEVEKWNADVEQRKAEKRAKRLAATTPIPADAQHHEHHTRIRAPA